MKRILIENIKPLGNGVNIFRYYIPADKKNPPQMIRLYRPAVKLGRRYFQDDWNPSTYLLNFPILVY